MNDLKRDLKELLNQKQFSMEVSPYKTYGRTREQDIAVFMIPSAIVVALLLAFALRIWWVKHVGH
ncbi:MAG TPA: hypothetical protein VGE35_03235 [Candidatus Paceibacterota bacterium]